MAKKQAQKDSSEVYFDTKTKAVMAQTTHSQDNLKAKIASVREVVPRCSNDEILLVLQHFDYDEDKTIQAFVEDGAAEVLKEWNFTGKKPKNNKKKNKKKNGGGQQKQSTDQGASSQGQQQDASKPKSEKNNKDVLSEKKQVDSTNKSSGSKTDTTSKDDIKPAASKPMEKPSHKEPAKKTHQDQAQKKETKKETRPQSLSMSKSEPSTTQPTSASASHSSHHGGARGHSHGNRSRHSSESKELANRNRTVSESSQASNPETRNKRKPPIAVLERPIKDLQRTTVPLTRYRNLLHEEYDKSCKRIKKTFEEIRKHLEEREEELTKELEHVKLQGNEMLDDRQKKAGELKRICDRAHSMKETEIADLKAEIKHFVGERKVDEEIGKTLRFQWNDETLIKTIREFGEVVPIKTHYSQRRPSASSVTSSLVSHDDWTPLQTPTTPTAPLIPMNTPTVPHIPMNTPTVPHIPMDKKPESEPESPENTEKAVAELAAKLQKSLNFQQQGMSSRDRNQGRRQHRPRNPDNKDGQQQQQQQQQQPGTAKKSRSMRRREKYKQKMLNEEQHHGDGEGKESVKRSDNHGNKGGDNQSSQEPSEKASSASSSPQHRGSPRRQNSPGKGQRSQRQGQWGDKGQQRTHVRQRQNNADHDQDKRKPVTPQENGPRNEDKEKSDNGPRNEDKGKSDNGPRNEDKGKGDNKANEHVTKVISQPDKETVSSDGDTKMLQNDKQTHLDNNIAEERIPKKEVPTHQMNGTVQVNGDIPNKDENRNMKINGDDTDALPQRKPRQRPARKAETIEVVNGVQEEKTADLQ